MPPHAATCLKSQQPPSHLAPDSVYESQHFQLSSTYISHVCLLLQATCAHSLKIKINKQLSYICPYGDPYSTKNRFLSNSALYTCIDIAPSSVLKNHLDAFPMLCSMNKKISSLTRNFTIFPILKQFNFKRRIPKEMPVICPYLVGLFNFNSRAKGYHTIQKQF